MITNFLKAKCTIQTKTATSGPLGETETWATEETRWCRRVSVDVATKTAYMQNNTIVTYKFVFDGTVALLLGQQRIIYQGKVYELVESAQHIEGKTVVMTVVMTNGGS
jgi:hypothetical protein